MSDNGALGGEGDNQWMRVKETGAEDWFLQLIVKLSNDTGIGMGLTLNVNGAIVTGTLIGIEEYFKRLTASVAGLAEGNDVAAALAQGLDEVASSVKEVRAEDPDNRPPPLFIHLDGAKYYTGGGDPIPNGGVLWRGKLSDVASFSFGEFAPA